MHSTQCVQSTYRAASHQPVVDSFPITTHSEEQFTNDYSLNVLMNTTSFFLSLHTCVYRVSCSRDQLSQSVIQLNLGKPLDAFVVLNYFNFFCFICSLQTAESVNFDNKPDLGIE